MLKLWMFLSLCSSPKKSIKKTPDNLRLKREPFCGKTRRVRTRRETLAAAAAEASYVAVRLKQLGLRPLEEAEAKALEAGLDHI